MPKSIRNRRIEQRIEFTLPPGGCRECKDCRKDVPNHELVMSECGGQRCADCHEKFEVRIQENQARIEKDKAMLNMIHIPRSKPEPPVPRYSQKQKKAQERHWRAVVESLQEKPVKQDK